MRANWYGIGGWLLLLVAFALALFVIPYPINGYGLLTIALGVAGGFLLSLAVRPES